MLKKVVLLLILFLLTTISFVFEGGAMGEKQDYISQIKAKLKEVNTSDGINKEEAVVIAQNYIIEKVSVNKDIKITKPTVGESHLVDGCWYVGFSTTLGCRLKTGLKWYTVHLDKETGEIKSKGWGPS